MSAADVAKDVATVLVGALGAAVTRAIEGGSLDDALATASEHVTDARLKAKFPDYQPGSGG